MAAPAKKSVTTVAPTFTEPSTPAKTAEQLEKENPELLQSPSHVGEEDVEIAKRSQDVHEREASEHRKVFVLQREQLTEGDSYAGPEHEATHAANIDAMRQGMVLQGLRPTEDGRFVGAEVTDDGQSVALTYACACVPAAVATTEENVVAVTVEDQHRLDEQTARGEKSARDKE